MQSLVSVLIGDTAKERERDRGGGGDGGWGGRQAIHTHTHTHTHTPAGPRPRNRGPGLGKGVVVVVVGYLRRRGRRASRRHGCTSANSPTAPAFSYVAIGDLGSTCPAHVRHTPTLSHTHTHTHMILGLITSEAHERRHPHEIPLVCITRRSRGVRVEEGGGSHTHTP